MHKLQRYETIWWPWKKKKIVQQKGQMSPPKKIEKRWKKSEKKLEKTHIILYIYVKKNYIRYFNVYYTKNNQKKNNSKSE